MSFNFTENYMSIADLMFVQNVIILSFKWAIYENTYDPNILKKSLLNAVNVEKLLQDLIIY